MDQLIFDSIAELTGSVRATLGLPVPVYRRNQVEQVYLESVPDSPEATLPEFRKRMAAIAEKALRRMLGNWQRNTSFFSDQEIDELTELCAAVLARADLEGRVKVRLPWQDLVRQIATGQVTESRQYLREDTMLPPERALDYFTNLVPTLGRDPQRFGADMRRRAFTMATATNTELLSKVQGIIRDRLASGTGISTAAADIKDVLDQAGVSVRNPQYAEMVFRTNVKDAYNQGADQERTDPDVAEMFPVWMYTNPADSRSRPDHAERNGKYYPASASFVSVRDSVEVSPFNCRCDQAPVSKFRWNKLKAGGARIADGYPDVPSIDEMQEQPQVMRKPEPVPQPVEPVMAQIERPAPPHEPVVIAPMPAQATVATIAPSTALRTLADNFRTIDFADIEPGVSGIIGDMSAAEAVASAQAIGVRATSRAGAIRAVTQFISDRKATWERISEIGSKPLPPHVQTSLPLPITMPTPTVGMRVQLTPLKDAIRVSLFDAGAMPVVVKPNDTFLGWTYNELLAMGKSSLHLKAKV